MVAGIHNNIGRVTTQQFPAPGYTDLAWTKADNSFGGDVTSAEGKLVYFMSVENARFRKPVGPGDQLRIHVVKERNRANVWKFRGEARVDGQLMAEATFAAMIMES